MRTAEFFATHPVFSLDEAARALVPPGGRAGMVERLKYYLEMGRLRLVTRGVYAVVPPGTSSQFRPDPFLVAVATRPDGIFSHHSALELLGAAHSVWSQYALYTTRRRKPLALDGATIRFLDHPATMRKGSLRRLGIRRIEHRGRVLEVTGPERTLVEGFLRPGLAGGLEELVVSASGFTTIDLDLLKEVLRRHGLAKLWAATGWFLERFQRIFHVPDSFLTTLARHRPRSPQYLEPGERGGTLMTRWNLIVPRPLLRAREPNER